MNKEEAYHWAIAQIRSKVKNHIDLIATLANSCAILKDRFPNFFWVGFYFYKGDHLLLGPFQGPPACVTLTLDKGVCAACARESKTIVVPNVHQFEGHVACDSRSNSEIVIPLLDSQNRLRAILDVDSETLDDFNPIDATNLETIAEMLKTIW